VPAIFPRLSPWHPPSQTEAPPWRLERVLENDEQTAFVYTVLALAAIVAIWSYRGCRPRVDLGTSCTVAFVAFRNVPIDVPSPP